MLPPEKYEEAARRAECHVQTAIEHVSIVGDKARLSGPVVKVFRGSPNLAGMRLELEVRCFEPGDASPPSGTGRFPVEALRAGRVVEAFVNQPLSAPEIPLGLCGILDGATETPQIQMRSAPPSGLDIRGIAIRIAIVVGIVSLLSAVFFLR
jgi:hypothetical protein